MISRSELREILHYDPSTGIFTWLVNKGRRAKVGSVAGGLTITGYVRIIINSKYYLAHRLAWLYITGKMPENETDHVNGIKNDNRIVNLREATRSENMRNKVKFKTNSSGFKGVDYITSTNKYRVRVGVDKKRIYLGSYNTAEEASLVYQSFAKASYGEFYCNGERK